MAVQIQFRRGAGSAWASANTVLAEGEVGINTTTSQFKIGDGTTGWNSLSYAPISGSVANIDDIGNVTITSAASGEFLKWNGTAWVNDAIDLGTDTTGNYVATITGGTGVTSTAATTGEGTTHTLSIGQAVATNSNVTFNNLTVAGDLTVSGATTSINTEILTVNDNVVVLNNNVTGAPTENAGIEIERGSSTNVVIRWNETSDVWELTNDGTAYGTIATTTDVSSAAGAVTVDNLSDVVITSAANKDFLMYNGTNWVDQPITLGTDTTGNYMTDVSAGTGISITHTAGEGSTATIGLNASIDALNDVTITSAASGQFLKWNGTAWINDAVPVINNIDDITGVTITSVANGQLLQYNGSAWVNATLSLTPDFSDANNVLANAVFG